MKPTFFLSIALSILLLQTGYAQKTNPHRQHRTKALSVRSTPATRPVAQPIRPLSNVTNTTLTDSLRNQLPGTNAALLTQAKPLPATAMTGTAQAVTEEPGRLQLANPQLINELPMKPYLMPLDKASVRGSYPLGISATKTTHIIFPSKIREFDAGTDYVLAQVPENVSNVLRVKANDKSEFCLPGSTAETNMTIITDDGNFYSFLVRHQADPEVLNINIANNLLADEQSARAQGINRMTPVPIMLTTGPTNGRATNRTDVSDTELRHDCQRIYERKGFIRRVGDAKFRISSNLQGLYVKGKTMYLQLNFQNDSDIDYDVDFVKFYLRDREVLKRMAAQEIELTPYLTYPADLQTIKANTESKTVYALPLRTLGDDKILEVELYERDGGRHLRFPVNSSVLLKARRL